MALRSPLTANTSSSRAAARRGYGYSLWRINSDGTGLKDVTKEPVVNGDGPADTTPQVSPDGKRIVFNRCFPDAPCVVATVNINGGSLRDLTDNTVFESEHPNWSPDSKKIVFQIHYFGGGADIAIMNADGSGLTQLTFNGEGGRNGSLDPCFSPDGTKILFSHFLSTGGVDLFTMNPSGSGVIGDEDAGPRVRSRVGCRVLTRPTRYVVGVVGLGAAPAGDKRQQDRPSNRCRPPTIKVGLCLGAGSACVQRPGEMRSPATQ